MDGLKMKATVETTAGVYFVVSLFFQKDSAAPGCLVQIVMFKWNMLAGCHFRQN
jgi:hypothetical protein